MDRIVGELAPDSQPGAEPEFRPVAALQVGERLYQTWQEAVEREIGIDGVSLPDLLGQTRREGFGFPAWREQELLRDADGAVAGAIVREQRSIAGQVELAAERAGEGVFKLTARVFNQTPLDAPDTRSRDTALMRSFASTHIILGVRRGAFASLLDPPEHLKAAAAECSNVGCWPVLVGEEGERDMLLASPIILYDYPQIAPESPGDLFDGTEIDEILTLRIMTMTDEEKREMGAVDERARALLARTEALEREDMMRLHGAVRGLRPSREDR
jgi:hydrogenase maturation protease